MALTVTRYAWRPWARPLETTGFAVAVVAYLFPFGTVPSYTGARFAILGVEFFAAQLALLVWPAGALFFAAYLLPALAAIAGLAFGSRIWRRAALIRFASAVVGFAALAAGYFWQFGGLEWAFGYYIALAAFLVAVAGSALRLIAVLKVGGESQPPPEPAWSASQELLRKHSR
jgi:hypothetical protein